MRVCGWVDALRMNKFVLLRDGKGKVQLIVHPQRDDLWQKLNALSLESVLDVTAKVVRRPPGESICFNVFLVKDTLQLHHS